MSSWEAENHRYHPHTVWEDTCLACPEFFKHSVSNMLPRLPLLLSCLALDWTPRIQLWDLMSPKHFVNTFFWKKKIFLKYLNEPCVCLLITKPLDLITIYLHVEKCSHWCDWYCIFLTLVGHQSPHGYWAPPLCQVEVGSGDIRESHCPGRACIAVVTVLFTRVYTSHST